MNKTEFMEGIHKLQNAYNIKFETEKLRFWYENLKDMSQEEYLKNIDFQIQTNQFMPNIAQIRGQNKKQFANYDQREYAEKDFSYLYANNRRKL